MVLTALINFEGDLGTAVDWREGGWGEEQREMKNVVVNKYFWLAASIPNLFWWPPKFHLSKTFLSLTLLFYYNPSLFKRRCFQLIKLQVLGSCKPVSCLKPLQRLHIALKMKSNILCNLTFRLLLPVLLQLVLNHTGQLSFPFLLSCRGASHTLLLYPTHSA